MKEILLLLPEKLLEKIDDFRFKNRFDSRLKTIRYLIERGLESADNKPIKEEKKEDIISRFNIDGELQVIDEIDGFYVVGAGMIKQVNSYDDGLILIEKLKRKGQD